MRYIKSPLDGNDNNRGRGKHNVSRFLLVCLEALCIHRQDSSDPDPFEFPTLFQTLAAESRPLQPDPRPFTDGMARCCAIGESPCVQR